jgi:TetR/AcrR family transcriptional regulator
MANKRKTKNPPPGHADDSEAKILIAAHEVFLRRGTAGARMQEIADEAGVNPALLHYYFRSKERLAEAVFRQVASRLIPSVIAVLGSDDSIETKVERFVHFYLDFLTEHPFVPAYIIAELHHHPERVGQTLAAAASMRPEQASAALFAKLRVQIADRVRAGTLRSIAPEQFMVNLLSLCIFPFAAKPMLGMMLGIDAVGFARMIEQRKRELPDFFLRALRP